MKDISKFPDPTYKKTVLAPLFEGVKTHYAAHMSAINKAHLVMLSETGILGGSEASEIAGALAGIEAETDIASLQYTGEHEDYFFVVEAALKARLGDLGGMLHTARSRNDMDHTLFKLALRQRTRVLLEQMQALCHAFIQKAEEEAETLIVAYTHGQPAQPSTFGHYLAAAIEVILRDMARLEAAARGLEHCPMGAAAITTSGFPIDRQRMAELLGFEEPLLNSYGCIASVDYVTGLYSAIKLVFVHLGRLIQDMAFWSSFEVGQLYVPNSFVQISSIMPQKRNPVPIEHMRHLAAVTAGRCDMMVDTMRNTPFTDMNDSEGEVQQAGYAAFESGGRVLQLLTAFVPSCQIDADNVTRNADAACITITELADTLVRQEALSFRQAHEIAAATARVVIADHQPLQKGYAAFAAAFERETGKATSLSETDFKTATSAENFVQVRDRPGGPARDALCGALAVYRQQAADLSLTFQSRNARHVEADKQLNLAFASLMES
ncbi:argininosuccinate lyase [Roseibium marinum]|uniref:Argininosuccinate lyase n=1 Tax=Roseibium marinum TaxID=281252 RepID=A0A2S3UWL2_9HYPH|nr:argininosuccinate lyase [Roseibium marinum]POF32112.1 argininosuccinate lyase [Roseibium marinum]